ncbi:MAG: hypothetical protein JWO59_761 [Chloroflexi bacterium]|nr:hypothetical protein [Chloroflexota bacterium]
MSVDQAQLNTPTLADVIGPLVQPLVDQAVAAATQAFQGQIASLSQIADAHSAQIAESATRAGVAVITNLENDPKTQRGVVLTIVGGGVAGCLMVLGGYILGNAQCGHIIGGVPAVGVALLAWASRMGTSAPRTAPIITVPPAPKPAA